MFSFSCRLLGDCKTLAFPFKFVFEAALPPQKLDFGEQSEPSRRPNEHSECDQRESLDWKTQFYNRLLSFMNSARKYYNTVLSPLQQQSAIPRFKSQQKRPRDALKKSKRLSDWERRLLFRTIWSGLRGSNSLPPPWQGGALPDELNPRLVPPVGIEPTTRGFSVPCSTN